ncbi:imidazole glycerol phosphate synthase subunit hisH [Rhizorhabdus wittichii RW1]|uniref:Imidazole glycerol phosphate synthase subunit HisH n=3 Tax=Rhizorhabdus wittichii TaxID=160791 RepID=A0A9J9HCK3_RHIWR|nr:imidazole glycerol phosphate synthase subunit HisH [Rhizorhabdus wittichii]ABQ69074.1 imidazole glycerol phosphate synthase subunit hisH [Rhizorhabdus wittichii RW1]QTH20537.1 imidazole glycerol phosphate synthase subunit HisH [Rhizorhabdus wittichii]
MPAEAAATIALIDYGAGNLRSVENALKAAGGAPTVTADPDIVARADRIVLPGVGAFAACMGGLTAIPGMVAAMETAVMERGAPFLGVCVGMQLLADAGHEHGRTPGLGWIGGDVRLMTPAPGCKVPHMGWNDVVPAGDHPLIVPGEAYYLHSYVFDVADPAERLATTDHGGPITAAVGRDNIVGVQFHPEKSQAYGLALLARFLEWKP